MLFFFLSTLFSIVFFLELNSTSSVICFVIGQLIGCFICWLKAYIRGISGPDSDLSQDEAEITPPSRSPEAICSYTDIPRDELSTTCNSESFNANNAFLDDANLSATSPFPAMVSPVSVSSASTKSTKANATSAMSPDFVTFRLLPNFDAAISPLAPATTADASAIATFVLPGPISLTELPAAAPLSCGSPAALETVPPPAPAAIATDIFFNHYFQLGHSMSVLPAAAPPSSTGPAAVETTVQCEKDAGGATVGSVKAPASLATASSPVFLSDDASGAAPSVDNSGTSAYVDACGSPPVDAASFVSPLVDVMCASWLGNATGEASAGAETSTIVQAICAASEEPPTSDDEDVACVNAFFTAIEEQMPADAANNGADAGARPARADTSAESDAKACAELNDGAYDADCSSNHNDDADGNFAHGNDDVADGINRNDGEGSEGEPDKAASSMLRLSDSAFNLRLQALTADVQALWAGAAESPATAVNAEAEGGRLLICRDCNDAFVFTAGEQAFYAERVRARGFPFCVPAAASCLRRLIFVRRNLLFACGF